MPPSVSTEPSAVTTVPAPASAPSSTPATPAAATLAPATARATETPSYSTALSRSAAIGATRDARRAGATPAMAVMSTPTATAISALPAENASPPSGSAPPNMLNSDFSSVAIPTPPARPATEATTPISSDSTSAAATPDPARRRARA